MPTCTSLYSRRKIMIANKENNLKISEMSVVKSGKVHADI